MSPTKTLHPNRSGSRRPVAKVRAKTMRPPVRWIALPCRCELVCRVGRSRPRVDEFRWRTIAAHHLTRVFALVFASNIASCRVLEKAGFVLEARLRRSAIKAGRIVDECQYAFIAAVEPDESPRC